MWKRLGDAIGLDYIVVLCTTVSTGRLCISLLFWCCLSQRLGHVKKKNNVSKIKLRILRNKKSALRVQSQASETKDKNVTNTGFWHFSHNSDSVLKMQTLISQYRFYPWHKIKNNLKKIMFELGWFLICLLEMSMKLIHLRICLYCRQLKRTSRNWNQHLLNYKVESSCPTYLHKK